MEGVALETYQVKNALSVTIHVEMRGIAQGLESAKRMVDNRIPRHGRPGRKGELRIPLALLRVFTDSQSCQDILRNPGLAYNYAHELHPRSHSSSSTQHCMGFSLPKRSRMRC